VCVCICVGCVCVCVYDVSVRNFPISLKMSVTLCKSFRVLEVNRTEKLLRQLGQLNTTHQQQQQQQHNKIPVLMEILILSFLFSLLRRTSVFRSVLHCKHNCNCLNCIFLKQKCSVVKA